MKRLLVAAACAAFTLSAFALPSIDAVQAEVAKGHDAQAEEMMREVVTAKPDSARAHYVYAEILAHDKHFARAAEEAAQAQRLDPSLSFTQPEKFRAFRDLLQREQGGGRSSGPLALVPAPVGPASGGVPGWLWGAGAALLAFGLWRSLAARPAVSAMGPVFSAPGVPAGLGANGYAVPSAMPMPTVPAAPSGPSVPSAPSVPSVPSGNGLLGTGLAVAGGMAAGMLAERLLEGRHDLGPVAFSAPAARDVAPGLFDEPTPQRTAAQALEERPIDFGTGDGWGGGDIDTGASQNDDGW